MLNPEEQKLIDKINADIKRFDKEFELAGLGEIVENAVESIEQNDSIMEKKIEEKSQKL